MSRGTGGWCCFPLLPRVGQSSHPAPPTSPRLCTRSSSCPEHVFLCTFRNLRFSSFLPPHTKSGGPASCVVGFSVWSSTAVLSSREEEKTLGDTPPTLKRGNCVTPSNILIFTTICYALWLLRCACERGVFLIEGDLRVS